MMQYIQKGEMALQQGMESEAINSFSMAACISYIGQGMIRGATGFSQNLEIVLPVNIFEQNFTRICSLICFR